MDPAVCIASVSKISTSASKRIYVQAHFRISTAKKSFTEGKPLVWPGDQVCMCAVLLLHMVLEFSEMQ
eukprot:6558179-Karenia_brevis.AAC.1